MVAQATGMGYCACGMQVSAAAGGQPGMAPGMGQQPGAAPMGGGMPGMQVQMPGMGRIGIPQIGTAGSPKARMIGILGVVVVMILGGAGYGALRTGLFGAGGKGNIGYMQLGIDPKKADGDVMMNSVAGLATKWRRDAVWWGVNYQAVHADGTVDLEKGATVTYVSIAAAQSLAKSVNKDSLKEFSFGPTGVSYNRMTGVRDPKEWQDAEAPPPPTCTIKQLAQQLQAKGLTGSKTVRITYDHMFGQPAERSWRVIGEDPNINGYFSQATCQQTK